MRWKTGHERCFITAALHPDHCTAKGEKCCREVDGPYFLEIYSSSSVVAVVCKILLTSEVSKWAKSVTVISS